MAKLNKEQTALFERLYNTTVTWGDIDENGMCNGLFVEFGDNL